MMGENRENEDVSRGEPSQVTVRDARYDSELDTAGRSLSEALRISFVILKVIMIVLIILFLASGFRTVSPDEQALVLRFGKIRGMGEERLLGPGLHWVFPYPIDEIVKIPVEKKVDLAINSFWYFQTKQDLLTEELKKRTPVSQKLSPVRDGYCITRSEKQDEAVADSDGSDYNIVHCKWQLIYQIDDPEQFFRNVYVEDVKPGQIYFNVITKSVRPLLESLVEDAVATAMVNYTIDEVLFEQVAAVTGHVKRLLQENLDRIESGITVVSVQLTDRTWPRQIDKAFQAAHAASQESEKSISKARTYAENTLIEAEGEAQQKIAKARAYRTKVVAAARANADYLQKILPEYRKRPKLVLQEIYLDAIEDVLNNADEKFIIQPTKGAKGKEIWLHINRDPLIKSKSEKE